MFIERETQVGDCVEGVGTKQDRAAADGVRGDGEKEGEMAWKMT